MSAGDWKLRIPVQIGPDDGGWFAESKILDYCAGGMTEEEAKRNFVKGLMLTALAHYRSLPAGHRCPICNATASGYVTPNFDWETVSCFD